MPNKKIIHILIGMSLLFLILIGYLTYFEMFEKDKIINNSYNKRMWEKEDDTLRGQIYDRNGTVLAKSQLTEESQERIYPYQNLYSHVIGYNSKTYGKALLEARYNDFLLNINTFSPVADLKNKIAGRQQVGNDLYLTIDHQLQSQAEKLLQGRKGAVVAISPKTGEVLALLSKPDFNPNNQSLQENWSNLIDSPDNPLLPRSFKGLYVPGSTYKVLIAAAVVESGLGNQTYNDQGSVVIDGKKFTNFGGKAYGKIDLSQALALSSNVVFSQLGTALGPNKLKETASAAGLGRNIPFDLQVKESRFSYKTMSKTDQGAVAIGQGKIQVTPLHMALIAAGIANEGTVMKPYLVSKAITPGGYSIWGQKTDSLWTMMEPSTAGILTEMMVQTIESGTAANAKISGVKVAGKTGTAENDLTEIEPNKEHAWFIGFAPAENPEIAVAVILEYSGSTGGKLAAPIARDLMANWLNR